MKNILAWTENPESQMHEEQTWAGKAALRFSPCMKNQINLLGWGLLRPYLDSRGNLQNVQRQANNLHCAKDAKTSKTSGNKTN